MNNLYLIIIIVIIVENIFLLTACIIWCTRKCITCQQVKTIDQIFQLTCHKCQRKTPIKVDKSKSQLEI